MKPPSVWFWLYISWEQIDIPKGLEMFGMVFVIWNFYFKVFISKSFYSEQFFFPTCTSMEVHHIKCFIFTPKGSLFWIFFFILKVFFFYSESFYFKKFLFRTIFFPQHARLWKFIILNVLFLLLKGHYSEFFFLFWKLLFWKVIILKCLNCKGFYSKRSLFGKVVIEFVIIPKFGILKHNLLK